MKAVVWVMVWAERERMRLGGTQPWWDFSLAASVDIIMNNLFGWIFIYLFLFFFNFKSRSIKKA